VRILLVQRSLNPPGGGNAVAAWMVHALAADHSVTTLTAAPWNAAATNRFYGTSIPEGRVRSMVVPAPWRWFDRLPEHRLNRIRMCAVLRSARAIAGEFDVLITADNYGAFAKPGIQYLHFPAALHPRPRRLAPIVTVYFTLCDWLMGIPWDDAKKNATIANSQWTADGLRRLEGVPAAHVVYPPVVDPGGGLTWDERSNPFLCIGRFHGSKRIERAMTIVRRLRAGGLRGARLAIVGSAVDSDYTSRLHRFAARDRGWIEFHQDLSRADLNRLMGACRFGVQAMEDEHFGMATAEMLRAGCLVFAHASGGSEEVLDHDQRVLWRTEDDAVAKIRALIDDPAASDDVRRRMRQHARRFAPEQFVEEIRRIVGGYVSVRNESSAISS
jgi:glycosyltransferase involved in cell wall biosynthesis